MNIIQKSLENIDINFENYPDWTKIQVLFNRLEILSSVLSGFNFDESEDFDYHFETIELINNFLHNLQEYENVDE
jgi:hypothetical protein